MKNRYKLAVGLEYDEKDSDAPVVGTKGEYFSADEIVKIAKRFGIPVVEKPELARALKSLEENESIPEELFEAVAIVLNELK